MINKHFFPNNSDIAASVKCTIPINRYQIFGDTIANQKHKVNCQISQEKKKKSLFYPLCHIFNASHNFKVYIIRNLGKKKGIR